MSINRNVQEFDIFFCRSSLFVQFKTWSGCTDSSWAVLLSQKRQDASSWDSVVWSLVSPSRVPPTTVWGRPLRRCGSWVWGTTSQSSQGCYFCLQSISWGNFGLTWWRKIMSSIEINSFRYWNFLFIAGPLERKSSSKPLDKI